jgi:hypothetical protein
MIPDLMKGMCGKSLKITMSYLSRLNLLTKQFKQSTHIMYAY